jgi:hypothetical protein
MPAFWRSSREAVENWVRGRTPITDTVPRLRFVGWFDDQIVAAVTRQPANHRPESRNRNARDK